MTNKIDWKKIEEWDKKYLVHVFASDEEYNFIPIEHTEGDYLVKPDGTRLLDCLNQLVCVNAGQCHPKIQETIREATERYGFVWDIFCTDYKARAAKLLIEDILGPDNWASKVSWCSTGSEAVEKAMVMARLYTGRPLVITQANSYHGWTGGAAQCTRVRGYRGGFGPTDPSKANVHITPPGTENVGNVIVAPAPVPGEVNGPDGLLPSVHYTKMLIDAYGGENIAAMITEPIFGVSAYFPPKEYLSQLTKILRERGIQWICDEVLIGVGKLGTWFGYQLFPGNLKPDLMTLAKGVVSSAIPAGGVVVNKAIGDFMGKGVRWNHCGTYNAHPIAMAAVCANLEVLIEADAPKVSAKASEYLKVKFDKLEKEHKTVGSVTGAGVLWAIELVKNKKTGEVFWPEDRYASYGGDVYHSYPSKIIGAKAAEKNVLLGAFSPNTIRFAMSTFVTKEDIDKAIDAFDYALSYLDTLA